MTRAQWLKKARKAQESSLNHRWNYLVNETYIEVCSTRTDFSVCEYCLEFGCPRISTTITTLIEEDSLCPLFIKNTCCGGLYEKYSAASGKKELPIALEIYNLIKSLDIEAIADKWVEDGKLKP